MVSLGAKIGERAIVAEGAVITMRQNVPTGVVVAGNPAKVLREVTIEDEEMWEKGKQLYVDLAKKYLKIGLQRLDKT
jgi:carbonic anhydrase/acetyltransferase-like protein (isoleucine patch superfamily)